MSQKIKVSVIVPIYNVEPYLRRCLDSLVNQTLKDIEIICINDCSPDNSLDILKEYAKKDSRVRVITNEVNLGWCASRNLGNSLANGDYIGTVDSDDYVDLDFYEKLYFKARETNCDIVRSNIKQKMIGNAKEYIMFTKDINSTKKSSRIYFAFIHWSAIYKNAFLKKYSLNYPNGIKLSGDVLFTTKVLYFVNKVESVNNTFYHYIHRYGSASNYIGKNIKESYGMPLVFDFINETITDKEDYGHFFGYSILSLLNLFVRVAPEWQKIFVQDMVNIYKNRKYPIIIEKLPKFLEMNDLENADILYEKLIDHTNNIKLKEYPKIQISNLNNRKLYIWGAGRYALQTLIQCDNNGWNVEAFLDSNPNVKEFQEYNVLLPQSILNLKDKDYFIVISSRDYADEIAKICKEAGLKEGEDFWRQSEKCNGGSDK